jgi:hypothetical protein
VEVYRRFRGKQCFHLQDRWVNQANNKSDIPENSDLHSYRRRNPKSETFCAWCIDVSVLLLLRVLVPEEFVLILIPGTKLRKEYINWFLCGRVRIPPPYSWES